MSIYSDIGLTATSSTTSTKTSSTEKNSALTQEDFLSLLTTQLAYQDPTKPVDNAEMVSQMAQISTVDGITSLNSAVSDLSTVVTSSQALMASSLVGQKVLLPSSTGYMESGGGISGVIATGEGASDLTISIKNSSGAVVYQTTVSGDQSGNVAFNWDGKDSNGNALAEGKYTVSATGLVDGKSQSLSGLVYGKVNSVTLGSSSTSTALNINGLGSIELGNILEVSS
ncbi:MAG: flagellar hook assembly protein FlgD [Aeromonadaceae bacterium]|nr:flagellar hook assembly protein FlgD [Aeromonadaceae bacterium]